MTRRKFSREFKVEAVKLVTDRGVAVAQAARDLDVAPSVLRRWMRELTVAPATAFPGNGQQRADLAEISALSSATSSFRGEILSRSARCWPLPGKGVAGASVSSSIQRRSTLTAISRSRAASAPPRPDPSPALSCPRDRQQVT